jgi:hypothetical protein
MWSDADPLVQVYSWQVKLVLNDTTLLNCTRAWQPISDPNYLLYPQAPNWNHPAPSGLGTAQILIMGTLQAPGVAVSDDSAVLCIYELEIMKAPAKYEDLYCSLSIDNGDTIWSPNGNDWFDPIRIGGMFKYSWTQPPLPPHQAGTCYLSP